MKIHVIEPDDTIYKIAGLYRTSYDKIIEINQINNPNTLVVGQALIIPDDHAHISVRAGQTLEQIASQYNIPLFLLLSLNPHMGNTGILLSGQIINLPAIQDKPELIVNGYTYPYTALEILEPAYPSLTYLSIFSYEASADGTLAPISDDAMIEDAIRRGCAPKMVITNIDPKSGFSSDIAHSILNSDEATERLLDRAIDIMREKQYVGLDIDFEYLYPTDREAYNNFLEKAAAKTRPNGYILSTAIAPKLSADQQGLLYEAHDYAAHGRILDEVVLMTYEWGYLYGPPMAVAPLDQVRRVIEYAVTEIPPEKILMGIPNYGYDWTLPFEQGTPARTLNNVEAVELAAKTGAEIQYDPIAASPYFTYVDSEQNSHIVWFEDARSIQAKLELVKEFGLGGISYWTVNYPFPQNWYLINDMFRVKKV